MTNFIKNFLKKHGYYLLLLAPPIVFIFFYFPTSLAYHADKINIGLKQLSLASREIKKDISDCRNNILLDNSQTQIDIYTLNQIAVKTTKWFFLWGAHMLFEPINLTSTITFY